MMKLAVIIVNYNVKYYLELCLRSLRQALKGVDAQVFVVDNNSTDGSVAYLKEAFPDVTWICNSENRGFAKANNQAIRSTDSKYVLLLNPDTAMGEEVISSALEFMDSHEKVGAVGVKMLNSDGTAAKESRRGIPTPMTAFYKMCGLCEAFPKSRRLARYYMSYLPWESPQRIEVVSGAFCLLRRQTLNVVGLLDEDFFMYGEDIDLSYRICKSGWENWYLPLQILHFKGESTQKTSFRYVHVFYGAMLIFFRKHYAHLGWLISIPIKLAILFSALSALAKMQLRKFWKRFGIRMSAPKVAPLYVFVTSEPTHAAACADLARRNGLDLKINPQWANEKRNHSLIERTVYRVYDTMDGNFSYKQLFQSHFKHRWKKHYMAFFDPTSRTIVTNQNIFR